MTSSEEYLKAIVQLEKAGSEYRDTACLASFALTSKTDNPL